MKTIALIAGTRPEAIKMLPVYLALRERPGVTPRLILTGQHRELAQDVLTMFGVKADLDMAVMQPSQTLATLAANLSTHFARYVSDTPPDTLLVQGDTSSAMIGGMFGFYAGIPVGHVEAGLRTGNLQAPFPEEFNRRVLSLTARWHFAPTAHAGQNLAAEGITQNVYVTGNTVIDAVLLMANKATDNTRRLQQRFPFLAAEEKITVLVTAHRRENFGEGMASIAAALKNLSAAHPQLHFIIPAHPNPQAGPVLRGALSACTNIHITDPLGYDEILFLIQKSRLILTDSGGIQEEAPTFDVPVLVLRNETERPEGIEAGCSLLVGTDRTRIEHHFTQLISDDAAYQRMAQAKNPYGDGNAANRIVDILLTP